MGTSKKADATTMTDNRRVLGEGSISAESGSVVTVLDNGAINRAFDFGDGAMASVKEIVSGALAFGLKSQNDSANVYKDAYADAKGRGAMTDYILIGALAMAGIVAYSAVKK